MSAIDWAIVCLYLAFSVFVGLWVRKRASTDMASYFVAGRRMSGWLIGTSMVATTFAADTPLAVTGLVAKNGIAGNWFWWSLAFGHLAAAFIFARYWRRAEIITDAELTELRYAGKPASALRLLRAFYFAVPINCIIMAWVIRAMGKIVTVLFPWDAWLGPDLYGKLLAVWPDWIAISSPSEAISIVIGVTIATGYATLGGLPGVLITDVFQFALAMIGSGVLAYVAVTHVGGLNALIGQLHDLYGTATAEGMLAYLPTTHTEGLPLAVFLTYVGVQWWAQKFSDGGGILVQRMSAAKNEEHALRGTAFFVVAHYVLRPWPWILTGLVALVVFPLGGDPTSPAAMAVAADREMAYPILMAQMLPVGVLGIMVAGMVAAFMSTVDTHITWGSSYLVRDIYQRFMRPQATEAELVRAARWGIIVIVLLALAITTQIDTIAGAWKFLTAMGSGLGLVTMARWLWWRVNAAAEIAGMVSACLLSLIIYGFFGGDDGLPYHLTLLIVVAGSTAAVLAAILLWPHEPLDHLRLFYEHIRPAGLWGPVVAGCSPPPANDAGRRPPSHGWRSLYRPLGAWATASAALFAMLFGVGEALLGMSWVGSAMAIVGLIAFVVAMGRVGAFDDLRARATPPPPPKSDRDAP